MTQRDDIITLLAISISYLPSMVTQYYVPDPIAGLLVFLVWNGSIILLGRSLGLDI